MQVDQGYRFTDSIGAATKVGQEEDFGLEPQRLALTGLTTGD